MRLLHLYLGVFTATALLFFAFTGALQTFSLHETTRGSAYKPPQWTVTLAQIHKKQTPVVAAKKQPKVEAAGKAEVPARKETETGREAGTDAPQSPMRQHHPLPLKIFFLMVSIALSLSTLTGVYMSYKYTRNRRVITVALVLGAVVPLALVFV
jgi:hypothetical protein